MQRDVRAFLFDVVEQCKRIRKFTADMKYEQYASDDLTRLATERAFIIAGEALVCLSRLVPDITNELPEAKKVIGFRNILVHNYTNYTEIQDSKVWFTIQSFVTPLRERSEAWLARLDEIDGR